ncbi:unnamed protein product [Blepharisma stoltei]|uniref:EF-hand domain-containing protein n=1 Tax=Blepharisma stoltei TaxID=1481888 RepID=A0AAU9J649_9CILI|nr:unnamed protein product [Blepharisma stoltei]
MSIFKDHGKEPINSAVAYKTSFGGGYQVPKHHESYIASSRETAGFQTKYADFNQIDSSYMYHNNLLSTIDQEIDKLKGTSLKLADYRISQGPILYSNRNLEVSPLYYPSSMQTNIIQNNAPSNLEEIERLRVLQNQKLRVLEEEYMKKKEVQQQKPKLGDILQEYQNYKKAKIPKKNLYDRKLEYQGDISEEENENTKLLKWIFKKIDHNKNGFIEKTELIKEIASNQELADLLGIMGNIQDKEFMRQVDKIFQNSGSSDSIIERDFIQLFTKTRAAIFSKDQQQQIKPTYDLIQRKTSYPCIVLTDAQQDLLEYIFKNTDTFDDGTLQKFVYIQTLRTDENLIKILQANAIQLSDDNFMTLEEVLDYIEDDGDPYENITFNQFMDYFTSISKSQSQKLEWKPEVPAEPAEPEKPEILLDNFYLQIIQDVFDTLPRRGTDKVSREEFVVSLLEDPQVQEFLKLKAREDKITKKAESVENVIKRIDKEAGTLLLWSDVLGFFSSAGKPKMKLDEGKTDKKNLFTADFIDKYEVKPTQISKIRSKTPKNENSQDDIHIERYSSPQRHEKPKSSKSQHQFTVPEPFEFDTREKIKPKSIRQQKLDEMVLEKKLEEEFHLKYRPKANPIPAEVLIPKYQTLLAAQEARRLEVKRNSKAITEKLQKPFNFHSKEKSKNEEPKVEQYKFKAKPPPPTNNLPLYNQMSKQLEEERRSRIEAAAKKSLEEAKLPPRMERYSKGDKNLAEPSKQSSTAFKAKNPPNFKKLWEDLDKEIQGKKSKFEPTKPKEFNFSEIKKKVKVIEDLDEVQKELMLKGFGSMLNKVVSLDPPAEPPKSTKKQQMAEEHRKKQFEEAKNEELRLKSEEEERKRKYEEAKQRVKQSGSIQAKLRSEEDDKEKRLQEAKQRQKEENDRANAEKQKMMERVNQRPMVSDAVSSFWSKSNNSTNLITTLKQKMLTRGIQPEQIVGEVEGFENIYAEDLV